MAALLCAPGAAAQSAAHGVAIEIHDIRMLSVDDNFAVIAHEQHPNDWQTVVLAAEYSITSTQPTAAIVMQYMGVFPDGWTLQAKMRPGHPVGRSAGWQPVWDMEMPTVLIHDAVGWGQGMLFLRFEIDPNASADQVLQVVQGLVLELVI